ncbi:hypothetical protein [Nocardiopsis potens]|uniref:hypothetical protein n=1 Tax=Nocardiopsis potens TaxID=1246458 RepID=UPI00034B6F64|nr:hypothetical protein [Nocardiopsis potens]
MRTDGEAGTLPLDIPASAPARRGGADAAALGCGKAALDALGVPAAGVDSVELRVFGVSALLFHRPDRAELRRRREAGQPPILRLGALEALMGLPLGEPVPEASLTERERALLRTAPPGAVARDAGRVVRLASVPLRVELAVATGPTWRAALARAARFAPFCARAALADRPPRDAAPAAAEADYYGVGLAVRDGSDAVWLAPPEPFRPRRLSAPKWKFAERVLAAADH